MKETLIKILDMNHTERQQYMNEQGDILIENMLNNIGYPEDELRDKLNYRLFIELLADNLLTTTQMKHLTETLKGADFLYASIGERDSDLVFTRSFSALWLCGLLNVDSQIRFLSDEEAKGILEEAVHYLSKENDVRGFVHEKGWAHAIAHGADLATSIVAHPLFEMRFAPILLQGIKNSLWKDSVYVDDEDERLVTIIEKLMAKGYPEEILIEWVEQVFDKLQFYLMEVGYTPQYFAARTNTLHFMKTLYFTLKFSQKLPELKGVVSLFIGKWMKQ
ncbi:DUF2785 domain-containing protein [Lysinibacillus halotolerans]|uniref:DUF2785 domain-containing protein n=2 Tax=Bacillales TaxID=1385 RepID=A0A3M8HGH4_9BACI|nr:DUF2785 domain-containing protein [Lysinibacillus halotolerans]RND01435.1 DUF2785 domain-containing protein [Lysinibacillus halotolerans]